MTALIIFFWAGYMGVSAMRADKRGNTLEKWINVCGFIVAWFCGLWVSSASAQFATATQNLRVPMVTVAGLPTCNAASQGLIYGVTDALTPVALSAPTGGGAVVVQVFCNGTAWIVS